MADCPAAERKLARELRERLADSLLPGEPALSPERLDEAAAFVLEAARVGGPKAKRRCWSARPAATRRCTRIAVVNRDMPFLVDSIAATIAAQGLAIDCPDAPDRAGPRATATAG